MILQKKYDTMSDSSNSLRKVKSVLDNVYVSGGLKIFIILYATLFKKKCSKNVRWINFSNEINLSFLPTLFF
jgi:hypothetical protein